MTERGDAADLAALARLRDRMNDADNAGDARAFAECLTEDVVIMAPGIPPLIDRGTCLAFVEDVFASYPRRHFEETIDEVEVSGDMAFDRGQFVQVVHDPALDCEVRECGMSLRVYRRSPDGWKAARVMWHAEEDGDAIEPSSATT